LATPTPAKSTLFNTLTASDVFADQLFATCIPLPVGLELDDLGPVLAISWVLSVICKVSLRHVRRLQSKQFGPAAA
jgi:hypothetical protein